MSTPCPTARRARGGAGPLERPADRDLICFWWVAGRQQQGRAILTITGLPSLPVLDVRTFDARQLRLAEETFASFRDWTFLLANEAYCDETRQALDRAVLCDLLGLPESILEPLSVLREQWCAEPTVHGASPPGRRRAGERTRQRASPHISPVEQVS